jgi:hypothetical protein
LTDVSYGLAQHAITLVSTGAAASYHVPISSDEALGTDWTEVGFDDSGWGTGETGVGFGDIPGASGVTYEYFEGVWDLLPDFNSLTPVAVDTASNFDITKRSLEEYFGFRFTAYIEVFVNGTYTFYTTSDDGSQLFIGGTLVVDNDGLHGMVESSGSIYLDAGMHTITVTFFEKTGGEGLIVNYEGPGISKIVIPDDVLWRRGVATDVQGQMQNVNASLWTRIEFEVEDPEYYDMLMLRVKYEDGFVAYLNGQLIAEANAPSPLHPWTQR